MELLEPIVQLLVLKVPKNVLVDSQEAMECQLLMEHGLFALVVAVSRNLLAHGLESMMLFLPVKHSSKPGKETLVLKVTLS